MTEKEIAEKLMADLKAGLHEKIGIDEVQAAIKKHGPTMPSWAVKPFEDRVLRALVRMS